MLNVDALLLTFSINSLALASVFRIAYALYAPQRPRSPEMPTCHTLLVRKKEKIVRTLVCYTVVLIDKVTHQTAGEGARCINDIMT